MPPSRVAKAYLAEAKSEFLYTSRSSSVLLFVVVFPLMFYVLVGIVFGLFRAADPTVRTRVLVGFTIMATMTPGLLGFGGTLAVEREKGLHTLRRALPMPAAANILAKTIVALLCVAVIVPALLLIGRLLSDVVLAPAQMLAISGLAIVGALPFCAIGFCIGSHASGRSAPVVVNLVFIPMLYLSGSFNPLPETFAAIAYLAPPFYLQQLMLAAAGVPHRFVATAGVHWAVLAGLTIILTGVTVRRFRRTG
jgi:ABC-2 type transport system permease protein